jgi:hypothetical protein
MNQLAVMDPRATLELAKAFADSKMVPEHFKKSVGDCYIAINLANRYGMDAWTLMQEMYLIQGKPMMSGKLATAILNNSLADPLRPTYAGEGDEREITLSGRPEGSEPLTVKLKVKDAKTANEQWKKNPDQMLMYAASRMWGRRYTPDIILGIVFDDEEVPAPTLVPRTPTTSLAAPARSGPEVIDDKTGEVLDHPVRIELRAGERYHDWGQRFLAATRSSPDIDSVDKWIAVNNETIEQCKKDAPQAHGHLGAALNDIKMKLLQKEQA